MSLQLISLKSSLNKIQHLISEESRSQDTLSSDQAEDEEEEEEVE